MGVFDFLKPKKKVKPLDKRALDIPPAPPTVEELPELPSPKEIEKIDINMAVEPPISEIERFENEAVNNQEAELAERDELEVKKPIFMSIELFRELLEEVHIIDHTLKENEDTLVRVSHFKEDEDKEFKKWESLVNDIQRKLIYVDKTLFSKKG